MACTGAPRKSKYSMWRSFPLPDLTAPLHWGEEPIPLYCPMKKSMCDTSCPGKEVSIIGNATERWCLLGETHEAQRLSSAPG